MNFKKAFHSVDRNNQFLILHAYIMPEKIIKAIQVMYENTSVIPTPGEETKLIEINAEVLHEHPLAP